MLQFLTKSIIRKQFSIWLASLVIVGWSGFAKSDERYQILSEDDVALYQDIFELQDAGLLKQASKLINQLDNPILMGHVLSQKYLHPTAWRSSFKELSTWLDYYNDHPAASRISWLAKKRKPASAKSPKAPKKGYLNGIGHSNLHSYRARIPASTAGRISPRQTRAIASKVRRFIRSRAPTAGNAYLSDRQTRKYLTKVEEAQLRGEIAHAYFIFGFDQKAIRTARHAIGAGRDKAWMGFWAGGLAAWRSGQYELSESLMNELAEIKDAPAALRSGAGFWSYRAAMKRQDPVKAMQYLDIALLYPTSFYGVMAMQISGQTKQLDFTLPEAKDKLLNWLHNSKGGKRALAMLQIENTYEASREIRYLYNEMPEPLRRELISFAVEHGMADLAFRVSDYHRFQTGEEILGGLYPNLSLQTDYSVDEALVFAIIRKESGFSAGAKSRVKAAGMMQIMPATAAFITNNRKLRTTERYRLYDPSYNISLGQRYIEHLFDEPLIDNNIAKMLAAYNGGPGNLNKWLKRMNHGDDTLMFMESIPARETRIYVKAVLSNLWMYRKQFGQDTPALRKLVTNDNVDSSQYFLTKLNTSQDEGS